MAQSVNQVWKTMDRKELRQLAVAVFFLFSTIGPLTMLMGPEIIPRSWFRLIVLTVVSGSFSAGIILLLGKPMKLIFMCVLFAGFHLTFDLWEEKVFPPAVQRQDIVADLSFKLSKAEIDDITLKRISFGMIAVGCLATGYGLFVRVIGRENKRRAEIEAEVKFAQSIHESLLPKSALTTDWCSIAGVSVPATQIGGDFYDIIKLSDSKILVVIADASGHGTGAGILSAMTKSGIMQELQHTTAPEELLTNVNKMIHAVTEKNMFITCALALLEKDMNRATIVTAGHPQILRRTGNSLEEYRTHHLALGIQANAAFATQSIPLLKGDSLYLITDGILEASNQHEEHFGMERLKELIVRAGPASAEAQSASIIASIKDFTVSKELKDDATLVVVTMNG